MERLGNVISGRKLTIVKKGRIDYSIYLGQGFAGVSLDKICTIGLDSAVTC
jgi:hypothetical protein